MYVTSRYWEAIVMLMVLFKICLYIFVNHLNVLRFLLGMMFFKLATVMVFSKDFAYLNICWCHVQILVVDTRYSLHPKEFNFNYFVLSMPYENSFNKCKTKLKVRWDFHCGKEGVFAACRVRLYIMGYSLSINYIGRSCKLLGERSLKSWVMVDILG